MNKISARFLYLIAFILLVVTFIGNHGVIHWQNLRKEAMALEKNNRKLNSEIVALQNKVFGLEKDKHYLEKTARGQLGLSKEGEIVYIFPEQKK